jgi:azurin/glucose/arabinose dehydrogenase
MISSGKTSVMNPLSKSFWLLLLALAPAFGAFSQDVAREARYYKVSAVPVPDSIKAEVGGLVFNDQGQLAMATRHGKIWLITDPASAHPTFSLFASGLHEPLGLAFYKGSYYTAQRGELTRITDTNHDGKADLFETVYAWPLSGNYHEYSYGPLILPGGDMIVTLNLGWTHGEMESLARWRGWMLRISQDGKMQPIATGLRSPAGFGLNAAGDLFYAENQGRWIGSGFLTHVEKGDFTGHPEGLKWATQPSSPVHGLSRSMFPDSAGTMYTFHQKHPGLKLPAVWFPQGIMGTSTSGFVPIEPKDFGPFTGQLLVGDQGQSKVMRVFLEKVDGHYQGACFPFREGFSSGVLRLCWGKGPVLYVGMTSRGWPSTGGSPYGLEKVTWTGKTPFEMKAVRATHDGFRIEFTMPVDRKLASDPSAYTITGFTYIDHVEYGSPIINKQNCPVQQVEVSPDGTEVTLKVGGRRPGYIHEIRLGNIKAASGAALLHDFAYYTLNRIPGGAPHAMEMTGEAKGAKARACGPDPSKTVTTQPESWTAGPEERIIINTRPGLKYDKTSFTVKAASHVELSFNNTDDMLHNLVIVKPGRMEKTGKAALSLGIQGPDEGFIPPSPDVLYNTCLLQPGASQSIYFTAPSKAGDYPYLCTYPGHYQTMNGVMKVVK